MGVGRLDTTLKRAVFFDRDGVLNAAVVRDGRPYPPKSAAQTEIDPQAREAIRNLRDHGFAIIVVTNQPDVARGTTTRMVVEAINDRIRTELHVDAIYTCFHDSVDACACRKPLPGMLFTAAREYELDLCRSYLVGDRWSDIVAGRDARCKTIWLERDYIERQPEQFDARFRSLSAICEWIIDDCNA